MAKRRMKVDLDDLLLAIEGFPEGIDHYFDPQTGELYSHSDEGDWTGPEGELELEEDEELDDRLGYPLVFVPPVESSEAYGWMREFAERLEDDDLRGDLERALEGRGAFRRFRDAVREVPALEASWSSFHHARLEKAALDFLDQLDIEPEGARRPQLEVVPQPPPPKPEVELVDLLVLGGKVELLGGRVQRRVRAKNAHEADRLFRRLARQICELHGLEWRKRYVEAGPDFELGRMHLRLEDGVDVVLDVETAPEIWRAFAE